jgi:hypothetical protein
VIFPNKLSGDTMRGARGGTLRIFFIAAVVGGFVVHTSPFDNTKRGGRGRLAYLPLHQLVRFSRITKEITNTAGTPEKSQKNFWGV